MKLCKNDSHTVNVKFHIRIKEDVAESDIPKENDAN